MLYLDYEKLKNMCFESQKRYMTVLDEQEKLFAKTQPIGIRFDKESVSSSGKGYSFDDYLIEKEQKQIDAKIKEIKLIIEERVHLLKLKETELRASKQAYDRIYVLKYLDGLRVYKIAPIMHYSESQVYRKLATIEKSIRMMRENANKSNV